MSYIKVTRKKKNEKILKSEYLITKLLLSNLDVEFEQDYTITTNCAPIYCGDRVLAYSEFYDSLNNISKETPIFRPLKNERHSNILIEMFEEFYHIDRIEISEYINKNNKKRYSGYIIKNNEIIEKSKIKSSKTIPILKTSIVAKTLFDENEYNKYKEYLSEFIYEQRE